MTNEYVNPKMPDEMKELNQALDKGASALADALAQGRVEDWDDEGLRTFLNPTRPNEKFLIKPGKIVKGDTQAEPGMRERIGDVWARFTNGVISTRDEDVIEWCEAHCGSRERFLAYHSRHNTNPRLDSAPMGMLRDIHTKGVEAWAEMKVQQIPLKHRAATLTPGLDIDKLINSLNPEMAYDPQAEGQSRAAAAKQAHEVELEREAEFHN